MLVMVMLPGAVRAAEETDDKAGEEPRVVVQANELRAADVAYEIMRQTGVQVVVTTKTDAVVSLDLNNVGVEDAVKALAKAFEGSWIRGYILERTPPPVPYTAEQFLQAMQDMGTTWFSSLSEEQRAAFMEQAMRGTRLQTGAQAGESQAAAAEAEQPAAQPTQPPTQAAGQPTAGQPSPRVRMDNPVARIIRPQPKETISLQVTNASLLDTLLAFLGQSGYVVLYESGLAANFTLDLKDTPVEKVLDEIARPLGAQWRKFYVLCQPKPFTPQELAERMETAMQRAWTDFWQKSPEERAAVIQRYVEAVQNVPPEGQGFLKRIAPWIMSRMAQYSANLTPEQRREIQPLVKALGAVVQNP